MNDRRKAVLYAALAAVLAGSSAPVAADQNRPPGLLVVMLIGVAVLLFFAGYFTGLARRSGRR
ncbi:MAG: hypothetical protein ABI206_04590 [Antricoccus sp.]